MMNKNKTLEYYNKNADNFAKTTIDVDFYETQKRFQQAVAGARIYIGFWLWFRKRYKIFFGVRAFM